MVVGFHDHDSFAGGLAGRIKRGITALSVLLLQHKIDAIIRTGRGLVVEPSPDNSLQDKGKATEYKQRNDQSDEHTTATMTCLLTIFPAFNGARIALLVVNLVVIHAKKGSRSPRQVYATLLAQLLLLAEVAPVEACRATGCRGWRFGPSAATEKGPGWRLMRWSLAALAERGEEGRSRFGSGQRLPLWHKLGRGLEKVLRVVETELVEGGGAPCSTTLLRAELQIAAAKVMRRVMVRG